MRHRFGSLWSPRPTGAVLAACFLTLGSLAEDAADAGAERSSKSS